MSIQKRENIINVGENLMLGTIIQGKTRPISIITKRYVTYIYLVY